MNRKNVAAGGVLIVGSVVTVIVVILISPSDYLAPTVSYERTTSPTIISPAHSSLPLVTHIKSLPLSATLLKAPNANLALVSFSDSNINLLPTFLPTFGGFLRSFSAYLASQQSQASSGDVQSQINALQRQISRTIDNVSDVTLRASSITGLSSSQVSEGSNLYYTDGRVANYLNASSTIPNATGGAFGNVLSWNGSRWTSLATSSLGISGGGSGTVTSITAGAGLTGGTITTSGTIALDQSAGNTWTAASTTFTSHLSLNTASSSVFTTTTLCLTGDTCRTTWPTGSSNTWPFTTTDTNYGIAVQSTTTPEWFKNGLMASTSAYFVSATTTGITTTNQWFTGIASAVLGVDNNGLVVGTTSIGANLLSGVLDIANGGTNNSSAYTAGSVIFSNGTSLTQNNSKFFWNNTNNLLGIGTTTPFWNLTVASSTGPQIALVDTTAGSNAWTLRSTGNNFSSPLRPPPQRQQ